MRRQLASIGLITALLAGACTSGDANDAAPSTDTVTQVATTAPVTTPPTTLEPALPADDAASVWTLDDQIAWVLDLLNGESVTEADVTERFTTALLSQASPQAVVSTIRQLQGVSASWTVSEVEGDEIGAQVRLTTESGPWMMLIATAVDGRIEFLTVQPDTLVVDEPPTGFDELVELLGSVGDVAMLAADVSSGTCQPIHAVEADSPQPVGSTFKLYVLGALVMAIAAGDVSWDQRLTIRGHLKSLPSGTFQDLDEGSERTVREFAEAMIAQSDNTATDHLIELLGRDRVESAQATHGHGNLSLNDPFLTTREFFVLKLVLDENQREAYIAAGADERRTILDSGVAASQVSLVDAEAWVTPIAIDEIEWFASPADLCRAMIELHADGTVPDRAPVRAILGANPGPLVNDDNWSYVGHKGGSELGVFSLAWYLEGDTGTYVYVVNVTNTATRLPEPQLADLARVGIDLLAAS